MAPEPTSQKTRQAPEPTAAAGAPAAAPKAEAAAPGGANSGVRNFGNQRRMISELERINALNLEPSLPKVDDGSRSVSRYSQDREKVKNEFQQFLTVMKKNDDAKAGGNQVAGSSSTAAPAATSKAAQPSAHPNVPGPTFPVDKDAAINGTLKDVLDKMLTGAGDPGQSQPDWPEAKGPSYHEVLGRASANGQVPMPPGGDQRMGGQADAGNRHGGQQMQGGGGRPPAQNQEQGMQQQQQNQMRQMNPQQMQQPPQGMQQQPQGYMMAPNPQQGGQQGGMFMMPGPQGMQPMQGMMPQGMQGQPVMFAPGPGGQPGMMMAQPGQQGGMPGGMMMMMAPAGGPGQQGQMPQGMQFDNNGQQQQMMFMPMMQDGQGNMMMPPQGMQGYAPGGNPGNPQQNFMMQQPMYNNQGNPG